MFVLSKASLFNFDTYINNQMTFSVKLEKSAWGNHKFIIFLYFMQLA